MDISKIDKNFDIKTSIDKEDIVWLDAADEPFKLYGAYCANPYLRMPDDIAKQVGEGVYALNKNTAGIRVRFRCDSLYVAIHVEWNSRPHSPHMTDVNHSGFDLYSVSDDGVYRFVKPFMPPWNPNSAMQGYDSVLELNGQMQDYVINFPPYAGVNRLLIGVSSKACFEKAREYKNKLPVVFYGSSITQGGCASRPGNIYQNFLCRWLDMDYINLGFSGNGQAQPAMVEYLSDLPMSIFVSDYDHNAPTVEHLRNTHYKLYESIRAKNKDLPYVMISKPDYKFDNPADEQRRIIIRESYERAKASGDENVYYLDGSTIFTDFERDACTVDGCHPNDIGFIRFAEALMPILEELIK